MDTVTLRNRSSNGDELEAVFAPSLGMNLLSYRKGSTQVIDQSTRPAFEERFAGLGPLIGPHFYQRNPKVIPPIKNESAFPHAKLSKDPFSHGIGRYAPWKYEATETRIQGILSSKDTWKDTLLSELEGQGFTMRFAAEMVPSGLNLNLSVVSDATSVVGIHYYYHLPKKTGKVISSVQKHYYDPNQLKQIPENWTLDQNQTLTFSLDQQADFAFHPHPNPLTGDILLDAIDYRLRTRYLSPSEENAWQLYHPEGASFVCIEPISSKDPRHANLTVSSLQISLEIET